MSTLGKVLIILIVLALLGWMFLASLVAEHHIQWANRFKVVEKEVAEAKVPIPDLRAEIYDLKNEASAIQVNLDRIRRNFRAELAMAQKTESETKETLSRYDLQRASADAEVEAAKRRTEIRFRERQDLDKQIAIEQSTVAGADRREQGAEGRACRSPQGVPRHRGREQDLLRQAPQEARSRRLGQAPHPPGQFPGTLRRLPRTPRLLSRASSLKVALPAWPMRHAPRRRSLDRRGRPRSR